MKQIVICVVLLSCFLRYHVNSANLPGPLVYVVTPKSTLPQIDTGRAAPFYYQNWMKRMDSSVSTPPAATTADKTKTPDLIFAEFESNNNMKSIRKLLEKEKLDLTTSTTTTTLRPIYVPDEDTGADESNYGIPHPSTEKSSKTDMTDYFALYNNMYNSGPVNVPSVPSSSNSPTSTGTTTTTEIPMKNVENIWHIIDNEKRNQFSGKWTEESIVPEKDASKLNKQNDEEKSSNENQSENGHSIDDNFALPGFSNNPVSGAENESRAIRTEPNIRFPYVNLKPFTMKNYNSKKANNMFDLGSFSEVKNPVRGEVQDTPLVPNRQPIERYNPAQPYLPEYGIGTNKAKKPTITSVAAAPAPQNRPPSMKTISNLVPPPPPPAPKVSDDDFPTPSSYESFPPYAPGPAPSNAFSFSPSDSGSDSSGDNDGPPASPPSGYRYKPPAPVAPPPPAPAFVPTLPPLSKPFSGYSYAKPPMEQDDNLPDMGMGDKPDFQDYHYSKPVPPPPSPPQDSTLPSYGHHDAQLPSYQPDYPELIYDKPHGDMGDIKGESEMKANDMGMMPPPPPGDMKPDLEGPPMDDQGFPHDFPGDFKYGHDFDEHDYHHHHHHHTTTTTTTTTEMPRVNRFSYYYLGKKLYYLPLYFSVYFVVYVGALIIKAVLRHKITYPNSYRPNTTTSTFFSKRSIEKHLSNENLHEITRRVTRAIATAAEKYMTDKNKEE